MAARRCSGSAVVTPQRRGPDTQDPGVPDRLRLDGLFPLLRSPLFPCGWRDATQPAAAVTRPAASSKDTRCTETTTSTYPLSDMIRAESAIALDPPTEGRLRQRRLVPSTVAAGIVLVSSVD